MCVPLPPYSVNGKIFRVAAGGTMEGDEELLGRGANVVISMLNMLNGSDAAQPFAGPLRASHRRIHARIGRTLRDLVLTDDPVLSSGGLQEFLREAQHYSGSAQVLALGEKGGVPSKAADVNLHDQLKPLFPTMAEQVVDPSTLLLRGPRRPEKIRRGFTLLSSSYPKLVRANVKAGLHVLRRRGQVAKHRGKLCLAGAFAVAKDDLEDRVITDPAVNSLLDEELMPRPKFAWIPSMRTVMVPKTGRLLISKRDARH